MHTFIKDTERLLKLSGYFGRRRAILTGRDTTALILLIEEFTEPGGRVILPATCCATRLASVLQAGRKPVIVDVGDNLTLDPDSLAAVAQEGDVVVAVHLFGIPFDVDRIKAICKDKGCKLIEDASQAIGGKIGDTPVGSVGDASILSFADRKIMPTIGGGAIVTDNEELAERLQAKVEELPQRPDNYSDRKSMQLNAVRALSLKARVEGPEYAREWYDVYQKYPDLYKFAINEDEAMKIIDAIPNFEDTVQDRRELVYFFRKNIDGTLVDTLDYPIKCAPFRFTFVMPEHVTGEETEMLSQQLKKARLDVNNLYLPLNWLAPDQVETKGCPHAEMVGPRVINLRIDDATTRANANLAGELVNNFAKKS
ncbi:MAG TPA: DegT/DnrJ/EryC1/StrS family aminotransferase [bacterium]|jgi:dTDP-4-amino-4,6-dideoxygalactose transaminase